MLKVVKKQVPLVQIRKNCDNAHKHCKDIIKVAATSSVEITQEYFNDFLSIVGSSRNSSCMSYSCNYNGYNDVKLFIISNSKKFKINNDFWSSIITYMLDDEIYQLILNQQVLEPNIISQLISADITQINNYGYGFGGLNNYGYGGPKTTFINMLISHSVKIKSFTLVLMSMTLIEFSKFIDKMIKNFNASIDPIIVKFIEKNKNNLNDKQMGLKIIDTFINRPTIVKSIYSIISNSITIEQKKSIFDKIITTFDKGLLITILENKDFVPDISTITKLVEKSYISGGSASNAKSISDIVDLLCEYGLKIDKPIVLKLLSHGCYINNFEKYGMVVDNDILAKCADLSYYPYKFDIIPNTDILKKECSKHDNINTIVKLKEFGGVYTPECLEIACGLVKNSRVIKYLINECGVKISDKCLNEYQQAYRIDALDCIMKKYKAQNPIKKTDTDADDDKEKQIEINEKSIMTIEPRNIKIDLKDNIIEYKLKNKIRKFFELKKKTIKYAELHEIVLRYLVSNKLVIGKYFVIDIKLSDLLKISHCVIMNTNQIHNILTYFIDLPEKIISEGGSEGGSGGELKCDNM